MYIYIYKYTLHRNVQRNVQREVLRSTATPVAWLSWWVRRGPQGPQGPQRYVQLRMDIYPAKKWITMVINSDTI